MPSSASTRRRSRVRNKRTTTAAIRADADRLAAEADRIAAQVRVQQASMALLAMSVEQAAVVLNSSPWRVRHECVTGALSAEKVGRRWRITPEAIRRRLSATPAEPQPIRRRA